VTIPELRIAICELISRIYCACYIGRIDIKIREPECTEPGCGPNVQYNYPIWTRKTYDLALGLAVDDKPFHFVYEGTEEDFLRFAAKAIRDAQFDHLKYFKGYKLDHDPFEEQNNKLPEPGEIA